MERLKRIWPVLASMSGAAVMVLAFFIPSVQDQWDRYQSRQVIEQYERLGNEFFEEERYDMAEEAYAKAYELSEQKRLDLELKRLRSKVNRIGSDPTWGGLPPDGLHDIDFQFLLHFQKEADKKMHRVSTLNCYGIFLASAGRAKEAEKMFREAIQLDSTDVLVWVNLANLYSQQGNKDWAEKFYRKAIAVEPENSRAHYNLGLLLFQKGKLTEANKEFATAAELDPEDLDSKTENDLMSKDEKK